MLLSSIEIDNRSFVSDIVAGDYRTADVFRKYDIDYCCGGKWPLELACQMRDLDTNLIREELEFAIRTVNLPNTIDFKNLGIEFLTDYISNIHHQYLRKAIPLLQDHVKRFTNSHQKKFTWLSEVESLVNQLTRHLMTHMEQEEEIILPYIRQIAHAYENKESYASLFVRTLRKPAEAVMQQEHELSDRILGRLRELTNNYTPPDHACISHKVTFFKMKEFDNDLIQHLYLENKVLFPRAITMEKELLQKKD